MVIVVFADEYAVQGENQWGQTENRHIRPAAFPETAPGQNPTVWKGERDGERCDEQSKAFFSVISFLHY